MPMSPRLLRPRASGSALHPDAQDWIARVTASGGSASSNTLAALSTFCASIATAGIRDRFVRLNLLCGNSDASLIAARTPLYVSTSLGGATVGNALDTNSNFVQGDYAETGASGGLKGNGTNKCLRTGVTPNALPSNTLMHMGVSATSIETSGIRRWLMGSFANADSNAYLLSAIEASNRTLNIIIPSYSGIQLSLIADEPMLLISRTATNLATAYRSGTSAGTSISTSSATSSSIGFDIFAFNNNGTSQEFTAARMRCYTIGQSLTAAQALAFSNAVVAFNSALGRA